MSAAGFQLIIISRLESTATFPPGISVKRVDYTFDSLKDALAGQDAVVCVLGPAGIGHQAAITDAAEAVGVQRFIINDFGWGPSIRGLPQFDEVRDLRLEAWGFARAKAETNPRFTWTGISSGNPIDWALRRFPPMGFDVKKNVAVIYDKGTEEFTGTTLEGIGQSVVGVLQHLDETANRFVTVMSIRTSQNTLLEAFKAATDGPWEVQRSTTKALKESGIRKMEAKTGGWTLDLAVVQLLEEGEARCLVAPSWAESDSGLLGVRELTPDEVVAKVLQKA